MLEQGRATIHLAHRLATLTLLADPPDHYDILYYGSVTSDRLESNCRKKKKQHFLHLWKTAAKA